MDLNAASRDRLASKAFALKQRGKSKPSKPKTPQYDRVLKMAQR